eukprot:scaffold73307_cov67-Phaeocystis_antarctica.AAC.2
MSVLGLQRRSIAQRCSPFEVRGRLLGLRCRARPRLPSVIPRAQHLSPHEVSCYIVRRRPDKPRRQRLQPLVVPPLRLDQIGALLLPQHAEGPCRGTCPALRARRQALLGLEVPLRGLHPVPRGAERVAEVEVRHGLVGPQGDGLAVCLGCPAAVLLRGIPYPLSHQLIVLVTRPGGLPGRLLRDHAIRLQPLPTILLLFQLLLQILVIRPV